MGRVRLEPAGLESELVCEPPVEVVVGTLLLWIVIFPLYLFQRGKVTVKA